MSDPGNNIPSQNPANLGTLAGCLTHCFRKLLQGTDGMLPAVVVAVDAARQYASVRVGSMVLGTDGTLTSHDPIARIPILTVGAGGFLMSFPVKPGDLGWILASDRDVSLFLQQGGEAGPNTDRLKSFEDGLFVPDTARTWALAGEDADNATWQAADGTAKLTLGAAKVKVLHPALIEFDAPSATMSGNLTVNGNLSAGNGVTCTFTTPTGQTVTVQNGIVTNLV